LIDPSILKTGRPACHRLPLTSSLHRRHRLRAQRAHAKRVRSIEGKTDVPLEPGQFRF
jgi:hypothetical protein